MKRKNIKVIFLVFCFFFNSNKFLATEKCVRGACPYGFFAEFLWALNHLEYCVANKKIPVIYWGEQFAYYSAKGYNGSKNGWEYYFEPVSELSYKPGDKSHTEPFYPRSNNFSTLWWYVQYIDNMHLLPTNEQKIFHPIYNHYELYKTAQFDSQRNRKYPIGEYHLYDQEFRKWVNKEIIDKFVRIKPSILEKIFSFYLEYFKGKKTIGLHLRGPHVAAEVLYVPLNEIFKEANKYAELGYQFFIATDQFPFIDEAKKHLKGPVIFYDCERFQKTTSPYPGIKLDPKLGEDLLIETMLLSLSNHLIHTLSNVSTAALYFNPELSHMLIY